MSAFSKVVAERPGATQVVPVSCWAETWNERPRTDECIGLRTIAEADIVTARGQAAQAAFGAIPQPNDIRQKELWVEAYNDALVRWILARGTCDPNDLKRPWRGWAKAPEDIARFALTTDGAKFLFDAWERYRITADPTRTGATNEDFAQLAGATLEGLDPIRAARVRRLIGFCLDEIASVPQRTETP